jgi:hypothetical protein
VRLEEHGHPLHEDLRRPPAQEGRGGGGEGGGEGEGGDRGT